MSNRLLGGAAAALEPLESFEELAQHLSAGCAKHAVVSAAFAAEKCLEQVNVLAEEDGLAFFHMPMRMHGSYARKTD
jgi:hypothetical protein